MSTYSSKQKALLKLVLICSFLNAILALDFAHGDQAFVREPKNQIATVGDHVTLPCQVVNKRGVLQWTRDGFGLGTDRNLTGYDRYKMSGHDEEGKTIQQILSIFLLVYQFMSMILFKTIGILTWA